MINVGQGNIAIRALWAASALLFSVVLWVATPRGLGLTPDSVAYLKAAQGLTEGRGLSYFSVQWPPLFSSVIHLFSQITEQDAVRGARLLNAVLYGCTFALTGIFLSRLTAQRVHPLGVYVFSGLLCLHPTITHIYFYALSEALFLPLVLLNLIVLHHFYDHKNDLTLLNILSLSALGFLATSTRYAGVTLVALNVVVLLRFTGHKSITNKVFNYAALVVPIVLLLIWWRSHLGIGDTDTNQRPLLWHPITVQNMYEGVVNLGSWFLPITYTDLSGRWVAAFFNSGVCSLVVLMILVIQSSMAIFTKKTDKRSTLDNYSTWIISTFCLGYLVFLILVRSLFDPNIVLDPRTLSPIFLPLSSLLLLRCVGLSRPSGRVIALILVAIIFLIPLQQMRPWLLINYFNGIELNDKTRLSSDLLRVLRSCPKDASVHSDQPWNLNLEFQSMVHWLPTQYLYGSWLINKQYESMIKKLPTVADLIVVEDLKSALIAEVDHLRDFHRAFESTHGIVWVKSTLGKKYCTAM